MQFLQDMWNEVRPALIIYGVVLSGAWALILLDKQFNFFN